MVMTKQVVKCKSCGFTITAEKLKKTMGLGKYRQAMITISKCSRCNSTNILIEEKNAIFKSLWVTLANKLKYLKNK